MKLEGVTMAILFIVVAPLVGTYIGLSLSVWANNMLTQLRQVGAPLRSTIPYYCAICIAFIAAVGGNILCAHGTAVILLATHRAGVFKDETLLRFAPALALLFFAISAYLLGQQSQRGVVQHRSVLLVWMGGALAYIALASTMLWYDLWDMMR